VQSSLQDEQYPMFRLLTWAMIGEFANTTAPIIGKAFFAASLKNSLLFWISFFIMTHLIYE